MTATRAETEQLRREGIADACVLLVAHRVLPRYELADWGEILGLNHQDLTAAARRFRDRVRPRLKLAPKPRKETPRGEHHCPHDGCDAVYDFARGLATHLRAHRVAVCDRCGRTFNAAGVGRHRALCKTIAAPGQETA